MKRLTVQERDECIDALEDAKKKLGEAMELMDHVIRATDDHHAKAYMYDQIAVLQSSGHGYLAKDFNMDEWIEQLQNDEDDDEELCPECDEAWEDCECDVSHFDHEIIIHNYTKKYNKYPNNEK